MTPIFIPDGEMVKFYATNFTAFSGFDHVIPAYMEKKEYPLCIIVDSDLFFVAEYMTSLGVGAKRMWQPQLVEDGEKLLPQFKIIWSEGTKTNWVTKIWMKATMKKL